ncbi:MAG: FtsX-like permease family protein [Owenweeksia sp.]|nr:FtsX-like permease family protein [Owenweeksia sp.]
MKLGKISIQNIRHRPLSSLLSILLLAFGTGIIVLLLSASEQLEKQFTRNIRGIDMVVGAKGSPLQLILSGVYHIDAPTGNIALSEFNKLAKNPMVETAIPLAYGDNYEGYRIVGTEKAYPQHYEAKLSKGNWWAAEGEVVLGASVAKLKGISIGDHFHSSHGLGESIEEHANFEYQVTGILEPTGTVIDKLILTQVSSVWAVHGDHGKGKEDKKVKQPEDGHEKEAQQYEEHHEEHVEEPERQAEDDHDHGHQEITVGLIKFRNPMGNLTVPRMVNQQTSMQAALPSIEINRLFSLMGTGVRTLRILAILIVIISAISVFISLYQSLKERKFELALLRTMGASSSQLLGIVLLEGVIIALVGYIGGVLLGKVALHLMAQMAQQAYQYSFEVMVWTPAEMLLLPIVLGIGALAALLPAIRAYRLNISKVLSDA